MTGVAALWPVLGDPLWPHGRDMTELETLWRTSLPVEFVQFACAYGDTAIDEYMFFCGPRTLARYASGIGRDLERSESVPGSVLPTKGGMLLWANTVEGDQLFLVDRGADRWTVSAWLRQRAQWYTSDLTLVDWLLTAFDNDSSPDWLPHWGTTHTWEAA